MISDVSDVWKCTKYNLLIHKFHLEFCRDNFKGKLVNNLFNAFNIYIKLTLRPINTLLIVKC